MLKDKDCTSKCSPEFCEKYDICELFQILARGAPVYDETAVLLGSYCQCQRESPETLGNLGVILVLTRYNEKQGNYSKKHSRQNIL